MNNQLRSIPPPLISLSSRNHDDPKDPFDGLFGDPVPSKPLFVSPKSVEQPKRVKFSPPSSAGSDFGTFVSVPPSKAPLYRPCESDDLVMFSPTADAPSSSTFFERFVVEAKERVGENERRVLDELLEHEDDPLYWLNPHSTSRELNTSPNPTSDVVSDEPRSLSPLPERTLPSGLQKHHKAASLPHFSESSSLQPINHARSGSSSPLGVTSASTLSRKWLSGLLSNPVVPPPRTTVYDTGTSPVRYINPLHDSIGSLTHSSPFAAHAYTPPSGAPGFTGERLWNKAAFEFELEVEEMQLVVQLTGRREETTPVLTNEIANQLRASLPALPRLVASWSLLYSLDQHGVSLQTFYSKCASQKTGGTIIALRDSEDRVFGAWMGEQLRMSPGAYYGSGESFLWTSTTHRGREHVEVFKWTGVNEYVALCESDFISFGGGEGKYGLYLDSSLIDGSSARCPTFNNEVLCSSLGQDISKTVAFECVGLEAWAVVN